MVSKYSIATMLSTVASMFQATVTTPYDTTNRVRSGLRIKTPAKNTRKAAKTKRRNAARSRRINRR